MNTSASTTGAPITATPPNPTPSTATPSPVTPPTVTPSTAAPEKVVLKIDRSIGRIEQLTEEDQMLFMSCEETLRGEWENTLQVARALLTIREKKLYAMEYLTFEAYWRTKWEFEHTKVYYLLAVAEIYTRLANLPGLRSPDRESQIRPLMTLKEEDIDRVWKYAVELSAGRQITRALVRRAVRELGVAPKPKTDKKLARQQRDEHHQGIGDAIGHLLRLISQRASPELFMEQVQKLDHHYRGLLALERVHKRK